MSDHADHSPADSSVESFDILCVDAILLVTDYLDDALSANDLVRFRVHLAGCDGCTLFVNQFEMTIQLSSASGSSRIDLMPKNFELLLSRLRSRTSEGRVS